MPQKRNLNTRQRKFVSMVAAGETCTEAYRQAGYSDAGKPVTTRRNAQRLAKNAEVRASIEELRCRLLPSPGDLKKINEHAMGVIVELSLEAKDEKVRLLASKWLHEETARQIEIAEREKLRQTPVRRESDQQIIQELRMLYAKALPGREPPPLVEVAAEAPGEE
jgi:phage terminase small subunit